MYINVKNQLIHTLPRDCDILETEEQFAKISGMRTTKILKGANLIKSLLKNERIHMFSPSSNIAVKADIRGGAGTESLKAAIGKAVRSNGMLLNKIEINDRGEAWYSSIDEPVISIMTSDMNWEDIATQQEKIRFEIERGEMVRFFILPGNGITRLLIIAHHLAGDGLSVCYLLRDIMTAMSGREVIYKPARFLSIESLPGKDSLSGMMKAMLKIMNGRWRKTGKVFPQSDFSRMFESYWSEHETVIYTAELQPDRLCELISAAKEHSLTINSVLTTAFIRAAGGRTDTGLAASIREPEYEGMGNFATGISIIHSYDEKKDFWANSAEVQKKIYNKLNSDKKKYFLLHFMGSLEPSLLDAVYFAAFEGYKNKTAIMFQKMFGYAGNPKALSITNLTRLRIEETYGAYSISDLTFSGPLVPNASRLIGAVTLGDRMKITMHVQKTGREELEENRKLFERAAGYLNAGII